ncbi:MAG TPA: hypothetical protein VGB22_06175 [candidate division Zixibacteria bacterium]|jgi:predicted DNA-binding protein
MTVTIDRTRRQHALKVFVSTEMKTRLVALAESLDRPLADVCRALMWAGLPILEGVQHAQNRGADWWIKRTRGDQEGTIEETV